MEENKGSHKIFKIIIMLTIIGIIFLMKKENQEILKNTFRTITIKEKSLVPINKLPMKDVDDINIYDDVIALWKDGKLSFLNEKGDVSWEKDFHFSDPQIRYGEDIIYITDKSTGDIYFINYKGETIKRIQLDEELFNIKVDDNSLIAHIKTTDLETINIIDKEGESIRKHSTNNNILTYGINNNHSNYILSTLILEEDKLFSELSIHLIDGEELGKIQFPNEIVIYSQFVKDDIISLTDRSLYFIKDGKIQWKKQTPLISDIYIEKDRIYILYNGHLEEINYQGRTENKMKLNEDYNKIIPFGKGLVLYGENNLIGIQDSMEIFRLKSNHEILGVYEIKGNLMLFKPLELELFKFKNKN